MNGLKELQQNNNNTIITPQNKSEVTSNKILSQQNIRIQGNFTVQGGGQAGQNNQPFSQHSKVTSIIRRRTNNYDEDEEDYGMVDNYSQSSHTYIALQDKGEIRKQHTKTGSYLNDQQAQNAGVDSTIDMNFLKDINNECNYLITKFQDDNYISQKGIKEIQQQQRLKSGDMSKRPIIGGGQQILQDDQQHQTSSSKLLNGESRSSKTVGRLNSKERQQKQLETSGAKKIVTPLTGKNITNSGRQLQQKFMIKEYDHTQSNAQTLHHQYNSGVLSNTDQSERLKTAEYIAKTFDKQSAIVQNTQFNLNVESQTLIHDNDTLSLSVLNKDKKVYEDASLKYVSSYHNEDHQSKYSISDIQSQNNQKQSAVPSQNGHTIVNDAHQRNNLNENSVNKLTFRNEINLQDVDKRNEYQLPHDDSSQQQHQDPPAIIQQQQTTNAFINEPTAQFDMQNFSALDRRIDGNSVDSSRDFSHSKLNDMLSQQTPYSQNQLMFGTTQKVHGQNIYSDQDSNSQLILSNREKRYMNHDNTSSHQKILQQDDQDQEYDQDDQQYEEDNNDDDDYQDDSNMPFSDNDLSHQQQNNYNQQQKPSQQMNKQPSNSGELLFTNNQHIFKKNNESDEEDHKQFMPVPTSYQQKQGQNNKLPFMLPQDDDEDQDDNNDIEMPMPPQPPQYDTNINNLNDNVVYNRLPKKYFAQEDEEVKDSEKVLSSIHQMRQDFIGYINDNNIQQKLNEIQSIIEPEKFIQKHFGNEDPTEILFEKVISPQNIKSKKQSTENLQQNQSDYFSNGNNTNKNNNSHKNSQQKTNQNIHINKVKAAIIEEEIESSPDRKTQLLDSSYIEKSSPQNNNKRSSKIRSTKESARQLRIKSAKNVINPPDSSLYTVGQVQAHNGPRILKMADYFKDHSNTTNNKNQNYIKDFISDNETVNDQQQNQLFNQRQLQQHDDEEELISLNEQEKEVLKQRMEQDILSNIDINFLFNKGDQLRFGLIDQQKAYKLMMKIKEVANQQLEKGSKQIDYNEIVRYLDEEELYDGEDKNVKMQQELENNPNIEPIKSKVPSKEVFTQEMWAQVIDFMRKNPKLLMQMLPDETDEETNNEQQQIKSKNKVLQQIEEAKRWAKLQSLSKNFLQKRDLLEAIDNQQNYRLPSPSKNNSQKEGKLLNFKQLSKSKTNQDKQYSMKSPANIKVQDQINSGSDSEAQAIKSQPKSYQKQFQYNSVHNAKNIYQNPAFIHPDINQNQTQQQQQLNSNRPIQSQQQTRVKSQMKIKKNSVMSTTMGDITTLGTTTGNMTNLNQYKQHNLLGSQNQTIDETSYPLQGGQNCGVMSMMQNYNNQNDIVNGGNNSHRRPTTASAAQQYNKNRSIGYMKPILQQRQDSFDMTTNKSNKFSRAGSISKNSYAKRQFVETSDLGNQSAIINNYYSQPGQIDVLSGGNNLNQSFGGGSIIGQKFAPINLGPSRLTQKYIHKIAPSLKENELYPKILNKPRGSSQSKDSQVFNNRKFVTNEQVTTPTQHIPMIHKRSFVDYQRQRSDVLNQSASNLSTKNNQEHNENNYEQTPVGVFPKFVKPNALNRSTYSRKESNNDLDQSVDNLSTTSKNQPKKFINPKHYVNQTMQTRIGGIHNKLLISPQTGTTDPFKHDELSRQDSQMSDKFSKKHLKIPIVDWAYTQLFSKVLKQKVEFNKDQDMSIYLEKEVDYVIDMMKNKYKDFKRSDIMRPFYLKALQTIQALLLEQGLQTIFDKMSKKYKEITIENTMKLLIRCKLAFHARGMLLDLLNELINYELKAVELKKILDKHSKYRIPKSEYDEIQNSSKQVFDIGHELLVKIKTLRSVHKQFKTPFIFKKKDYINYVKSEMNEVKKLISIFKVQGINSPSEQDDLNKFLKIHAENQSEHDNNNILRKIEENKNETEEQSYYSTDNQHNNQDE